MPIIYYASTLTGTEIFGGITFHHSDWLYKYYTGLMDKNLSTTAGGKIGENSAGKIFLLLCSSQICIVAWTQPLADGSRLASSTQQK